MVWHQPSAACAILPARSKNGAGFGVSRLRSDQSAVPGATSPLCAPPPPYRFYDLLNRGVAGDLPSQPAPKAERPVTSVTFAGFPGKNTIHTKKVLWPELLRVAAPNTYCASR